VRLENDPTYRRIIDSFSEFDGVKSLILSGRTDLIGVEKKPDSPPKFWLQDENFTQNF